MTFEELKQITKQPITDDDMFRIRLNIAESKQAEMAMGAAESGKTTLTGPQKETPPKTAEKTTEKILSAIQNNPQIPSCRTGQRRSLGNNRATIKV